MTFTDHPFYAPRAKTDVLFPIWEQHLALQGRLAETLRFIQGHQLTDAAQWKKFVSQFRTQTDSTDDGWRGEYWGKMMRGACFVYSCTRDEELYETLTATVRDLLTTEDSWGRISSYTRENEYSGWDVWSRKYVLLGLQYYMEHCRDAALREEITLSLIRQTDYLFDTLGPREDGKIPVCDASNCRWNGMNACSVLEPVVRMYNLTGEKRYLELAAHIVDCGGISNPGVSLFELALEDKIAPAEYPLSKAYEMMSCFEGLLEYYRVTGIQKWRTATENFVRKIRESGLAVIGTAGCTNEIFDHAVSRQTNTGYCGVSLETCVTVTWMKLCLQLLCLTGDSTLADEMELSLFNAYLGAVNFERDPRVLPFDSYSPVLFNTRHRGIGGIKYITDTEYYGCCASIGSAGAGLVGQFAAMTAGDGFRLNLYAPGTLTLPRENGTPLTLTLRTAYPVDGRIEIVCETAPEDEITLGLRIPAWSEESRLDLNGEALSPVPGSYCLLPRRWQPGDTLVLELDMRCRVLAPAEDPADPNGVCHTALRRGPLVLARDARLPGDLEAVVSFAADSSGAVPCVPSDKAEFRHLCCFDVTAADSSTVTVVDYASAGTTWDERSMMTVWMPTRKYWNTDLKKPVEILCPNVAEDITTVFHVYTDDSGMLSVSPTRRTQFLFEQVSEQEYRIKTEDGVYLALSPDGERIVTAETGTLWRLERVIQDRWRIYAPDGRAVMGSNYLQKRPNIQLEAPSFAPRQIFRLI